MKHKFQRILSVILCVCMMLSYIPIVDTAEALDGITEGIASSTKGFVFERDAADLPDSAKELGETDGITAYLIPNRGPAFVHEHTLYSYNVTVTKASTIAEPGLLTVSCNKCSSELELVIPQLIEDYIQWEPKTAEYTEEEQTVTYGVKAGEISVSGSSFGDYTCEWTDWGNFLPAGTSSNNGGILDIYNYFCNNNHYNTSD